MTIFKKYCICACLKDAHVNLNAINARMIAGGHLARNTTEWARPQPLGGSVENNGTSRRFFYENPNKAGVIIEDVISDLELYEQTDTDPRFTELEDYKIYDFITPDKKKTFPDKSVPPFSLDFECDLTISMPEEHIMNSYGAITKVNFYESVEQTIDETTQITTEEYTNKLAEATFDAVIGSDKHIKCIIKVLKFVNTASTLPDTGMQTRATDLLVHQSEKEKHEWRKDIVLEIQRFLNVTLIELDATITNLEEAIEEQESFWEAVAALQGNFVDNGNINPLKNKIDSQSDTFLDEEFESVTLREHIKTILDNSVPEETE